MTGMLLLLNGSLIAGIYALAKAGGVPPLGMLAWQLLFAAAVVGVVARWRRQTPPLSFETLRYAAVAGALGISGPNLATFSALAWVPAGLVGVIGALSPLFTYAFALALRVEPPRALRAAGIGLGLAGVLVLLLPRGGAVSGAVVPWALLAMAAPALLAAGNLFRSLAWPAALPPLGAASLMLALQAAVLVPVAWLTGDLVVPRSVDAPADLALIGGGALTSVFYLTAFELQRRAGPVVVGQLGYVITVVSLLIGALAFGERYAGGMILAVALVFAGLALVLRAGPSAERGRA